VRCLKDGMIVLVSVPTVWAALCDFNSRSKWAAPQYRLELVTEEVLREGTQISCNMGLGEGSLFVGKLNYSHELMMLGVIGKTPLHVCFKLTEILDGSYVEVCLGLDNEPSLEEEVQLVYYRDWMLDQLRTIKRQAELAPRTRR
jgi:hypothetical protein